MDVPLHVIEIGVGVVDQAARRVEIEERPQNAVAAKRLEEGSTGLYL